jgi:hypothetical protein
VRDTKLEKANHEATPKHQGNLKRSLRDLFRGHERDERDKERAKAEVARLNGVVSGEISGAGASSSSSAFGRGPILSIPKPQATAAQRKQQLAQLAEMGISIPGEFRPDMAMAGEWEVTEEHILEIGTGEKKADALAMGIKESRKRDLEDADEDEEALEAKKMRWGSTYRKQPTEEDDADLDALLGNVTWKGKGPATKNEAKDEVKVETKKEQALNIEDSAELSKVPEIKRELSDEQPIEAAVPPIDTILKEEEVQGLPGVVFKKRKAKNIRQK